eukprot:gene18271-biopygen38785
MHSDHALIETTVEMPAPVRQVDAFASRSGIPRKVADKDKPEALAKFEACRDEFSEAILSVDKGLLAADAGIYLNELIDAGARCLQRHEKPRPALRSRDSIRTEIHRLRSWALVADALHDETLRGPQGARRGGSETRGGIEESFRHALYAARLSEALLDHERRCRRSRFYDRHADVSWHWANMSARLGRPAPQAVDRVAIKVKTPLVSEPDMRDSPLAFTDAWSRGENRLHRDSDGHLWVSDSCHEFQVESVKMETPSRLVFPLSQPLGPWAPWRLQFGWNIAVEDRPRVLGHAKSLCEAAGVQHAIQDFSESRAMLTDPGGVRANNPRQRGGGGFSKSPPPLPVRGGVACSPCGFLEVRIHGFGLTGRLTYERRIAARAVFKKWAAVTSVPAYSNPSHPDDPSDIGEARQLYEQWLDHARIPHADPGQSAEGELLLRDLTREEFDRQLKKHAGMAAGLDGCTWELLQSLSPDALDCIFNALREFLNQGSRNDWQNFPTWLRTSWMSPIPKGNFDHTADRYRGISVTPAIGRLFGKIITKRLTDFIERVGCLCPVQAGFRRGRSTFGPVAALQNYLARHGKAHLAPLDAGTTIH